MHRIYCPTLTGSPNVRITDKDEIHHLKNVLRMKKGDRVQLFDGRDTTAVASIEGINSTGADIKITEVQRVRRKGPIIILACAVPKKGKFETIIEKTTELGVNEIIPLGTRRSDVVLKGDRMEQKRRRYEKVAVNAAKQCKRPDLPRLHSFTDYRKAVDRLCAEATVLLASLSQDRRGLPELLTTVDQDKPVAILIGPEGDFTPDEESYALSKGAIPVTLGTNVLRVETAAITAVGFIRLYFSS